MPFEKRNNTFIKVNSEMILNIKENLSVIKEKNAVNVNQSVEKVHQNKPTLNRRKSSSSKELSMSRSKEGSPLLEDRDVVNSVQVNQPKFGFGALTDLKHSDLFNKQKSLHNRRSLSVDQLITPNEFISSIHIEEDENSVPKPQKFPVLTEDVVIRKKTQPNTTRANTVNYDLTIFAHNCRLNEIKGVSKIVIGDEFCVKINRHERLFIDDNEIQLLTRSGHKRVLKNNVELKQEVQQIDKKNVVLHDVKNVSYQLSFETSKDAKLFIDNVSLLYSPNEKSSIKTKLLRLLGKRSSREFLVEKGIYRNEPIFGNTIQNLYKMNDCVPEFLTRSIQLIEMANNIATTGIYRTSGNLATIQKIRFEVDKGNLDILNQYYEDVDVLTGALKLFFRELKEPLIPPNVSEQLLSMTDKTSKEMRSALLKLPRANLETLSCLLKHLVKVVEHKEENKMDIYNLSICWSPSLMFISDNCVDIISQSSNNSKVLDILLNFYLENPKELSFYCEYDPSVKMKHSKKLELPSKENKKTSSSSSLAIDDTLEMVSKMVELIEQNIKSEGLYRKAGNTVKIDKIVKKLNKGKLSDIEKIKGDVYDLTWALKKYLDGLSDGFIPKDMFEEFSCDNFNHAIARQKLERNLSSFKRKDSLTLLMRHLARVAEQEQSKSALSSLSETWRNTLIRAPLDDKIKNRLFEMLLEIYGEFSYIFSDYPNSMPDVIKDIKAMGRQVSKYDNLSPNRLDVDIRGEARFLDEKTVEK